LYGKGHGVTHIDTQDDQFLPLLYCIEDCIVEYYGDNPDLTDGGVSLVLDRLVLRPECDPGDDRLCRRLQLQLRLQLSLEDYSRQEVRWAIRKILQSVRRHTRVDGRRGYLDFIRQMLRRQ